MEIGQYYFSKSQTATLATLIIGLLIGLVLVQRQQVFKSRAASLDKPFEIIQNDSRETAVCEGKSCTTKTLSVTIKPVILESLPKSPIAAQVIPPAPKKKGTSLASCNFTRTGRSYPFGGTTLLGWLEETARRKGIPPAALASFARHESEYLTTVSDDSEIIKSNYFCNPGQAFCEKGGRVLYYGDCAAGDVNAGARTGRAMGLMQVVNIYNTDIDPCVITTNIDRGADIFISKLGGGSAANETSLKKAVCRYFGIDSTTCNYGGADYAAEVWQDYLNCPAGQ